MNEILRLKKEKAELATELQRHQDLLKQQVDIDRENGELIQMDIRQLKAEIERDKQKQG